jgi:hypothetical protein
LGTVDWPDVSAPLLVVTSTVAVIAATAATTATDASTTRRRRCLGAPGSGPVSASLTISR